MESSNRAEKGQPAPAGAAPSARPQVGGWARIRSQIWPVAFAGVIFALSSQPVLPGPQFPYADKLEHFCAYALLATLICRVRRGWAAAAWALVIASAYGATDELHQFFVPGRSSDVHDWMADTLGAAAGVALYVGWRWYRSLLEQPVWREAREAAADRTSA